MKATIAFSSCTFPKHFCSEYPPPSQLSKVVFRWDIAVAPVGNANYWVRPPQEMIDAEITRQGFCICEWSPPKSELQDVLKHSLDFEYNSEAHSSIAMLMGRINSTFQVFGQTPLAERLADIQREVLELSRYPDFKGLRQETGHALTSILQLCNEQEYDPVKLVDDTLKQIDHRQAQYKAIGRKTQVAILGGAFDPVTVGHIAVAKHVLDESKEIDEVWLMPCYKHMYGKKMTSPEARLEMCRLAAQADKRIKVFDFEIRERLGGETYYTFKRLLQEPSYADKYHFSFIMGQDNANTFHKWVNFEYLERAVRFIVVPRKGVDPDGVYGAWYNKPPHIVMKETDALIQISSTDIRDELWAAISEIDVSRFLHPSVEDYIRTKSLYK